MEALPGPIQVDLSEPDAKLDQIRVRLAMMQGRVVYYNDGELTEYKFDTWIFSFLMNLDKNPVDMNFLASIDPAGAAAAKQTIARSGLPDSVFSIECLFLKATDRESLADGNMEMEAPAGAPDEAQNVMKRCVTLWRHAHEPGRFLLGTATRRVTSQAVPTFTVTDVAFQVHPEFRRPGGGSLAWLGMMEGHKPPDLNAARTKLTDPWMRPPGDRPGLLPETVMGIGRGMFMDRYLVARFAKAIGKEASFGLDQGRPQWTFTGTDSAQRTSDDIIRRIFSQNTTWTLRLTIEPHENAIAITGDIVSQVDMDGYIHLTGWHSEWIHTRGRQKFNGRIELKEDDSRGHFAVKPSLWHGLDGGVAVEQDETKGGAGVLTFFESTFTGSNTAERLTNGQRALLNSVMNRLSEVIKGLNLEFTQHSFIPPGGGVFTFRNPKFSRHGDLLIEAVYKDS
jgi:hypothetical protein